MTKENFLTVRWNNYLSLGIGFSHSDICRRRFFHRDVVGTGRLDRTGDFRSTFLTGY